MTKILAIGGSSHDFSAAILKDGEILIAVEDERLDRIRHGNTDWYNLPVKKSIDYCLRHTKLSIEDFDNVYANIDLEIPRSYIPQKIEKIPHHLAHASSSFFPSKFEEAAILVVDGHGSSIAKNENHILLETISMGYGNLSDISIDTFQSGEKKMTSGTWQYITENSLGSFYKVISDCLGFGMRGQGKVMGLASYGDSSLVNQLYNFVEVSQDGSFKFDPYNGIYDWIIDKLNGNGNKLQASANIAYALQFIFEEVIVRLALTCFEQTGLKKLCYSGGCALNGAANQKILEQTPFDELFIYPAAGDNGLSIGAAYYCYYHVLGNERKISPLRYSHETMAFRGHDYKESDYKKALSSYSVIYKKHDSLINKAKIHLIENKVLAIHKGRSEIGPRALGNRSILANPTDINIKDHLNLRVKKRETFRPFGAIVPVEYASEYFDLITESPFMLLIAKVKSEFQTSLPGVTHYDGTSRVQTLERATNPFLHSLLLEIKSITGFPILINTSFNEPGKPIVETPDDGLEAFIKMPIDCMIMGDFWVEKHCTWNK